MKVALGVEYFGKNYHGWQIQPDIVTVQSELNNALTTVLRAPLDCMGAGRTDTGVHAKMMVAHFDFDKEIDIKDIWRKEGIGIKEKRRKR